MILLCVLGNSAPVNVIRLYWFIFITICLDINARFFHKILCVCGGGGGVCVCDGGGGGVSASSKESQSA